MTNLVFKVVVALVTNVVETDNGSNQNELVQRGDVIQFEPVKRAATERYITTEVNSVSTLTFTYEGQDHRLELERKLISSVTRVLKLRQEWVEGELRTNDVKAVQAERGFGEVWKYPYTITNNLLYLDNGTNVLRFK